jgi:chromosome segregation ATPase
MIQKLEETSRNIVQAGNQSSTGLLEEIRKTNTQLVASSESAAANTRTMVTALDKNHRLMVNKFDEFAQLLANANTDALREAMENLVNDFNDTFRTLITNLVNQNFDELNISIRNLNTWQQSYRGIIENLVNRLDTIGKELDAVIGSIQNSQEATEQHLTKVNGTLVGVATTTESLVSSEGKLAQIIEALDEVLVEKNTLVQSFEKATRSMEALKASSEDFANTKDRISKWLNDASRLAGAIPLLQANMAELGKTLNALERIKMEDLAILDNSFDRRLQTALNTSFGHLDKLIKEYVEAIEKKGVIEINVKNVGGNEV